MIGGREREREGDSAGKRMGTARLRREILEVALPGCRGVAFRLKRDWLVGPLGRCICGPRVLE